MIISPVQDMILAILSAIDPELMEFMVLAENLKVDQDDDGRLILMFHLEVLTEERYVILTRDADEKMWYSLGDKGREYVNAYLAKQGSSIPDLQQKIKQAMAEILQREQH